MTSGRNAPTERTQYAAIPYDIIDLQLSPDALATYAVIVRHAYGNVAVLSLARISRTLGRKRDWARCQLRELVKAGAVEPIDVPHGSVPKYRLPHSVHVTGSKPISTRPVGSSQPPHSPEPTGTRWPGPTHTNNASSLSNDARQKNGNEETNTTRPCIGCGARVLVTQKPGKIDKIEACSRCNEADRRAGADALAAMAPKFGRNPTAKPEAANVV